MLEDVLARELHGVVRSIHAPDGLQCELETQMRQLRD